MKTINLRSLKSVSLTLFIALFYVGCGSSGSPIDKCTVLSNDIVTDTTLDDTCYNVVGNIYVPSNILLTIKPGTELLFQEGTQLRVDGALKAIGKPAVRETNGTIITNAKPVLFSGVKKRAGYWNGLYLYDADDNRNELDNIIIEYAGASDAAFNVDGESRLNIKNSIIRYSGGDGFAIGSNSIIEQFKSVTSTKNENTAGSVYANALSGIDISSNFKGNLGNDHLIVKGGTIDKDQTWKALSVPVVVTHDIHVESGTLLTIQPGAELLHEAGVQFKVDGGLKAVGTAEKPILFSGLQKFVGYWNGIYMNDAHDTRNQLAHVIIEYAGGGMDEGAIHTTGNSYLDISDTLIQYSENYGFVLGNDTTIKQFKRVTSTKNEDSAGVIHASSLHAFDSTSDFKGNLGDDYLIVKGSSIIDKQTWQPINVPIYVIGSIYVELDSVLTIKAGSQYLFDSGTGLRVDGILITAGTSSKPIVLSGFQKTAGYWDGIYFNNSEPARNKIVNTTVEYAGGGYHDAAIYLGGNSYVQILNSSINNSASYGIYLEYESTRRLSKLYINGKNSFSNNANDDVYEGER